ncbi:MAG: GNAT family N-acetyltransferase [Velocimicrobium sp.]
MKVKEITYYEYIFCCTSFSTPLSDYYMKNAIESGKMTLFASYDDMDAGSSRPLGFCIMHKTGEKQVSLDYILVKEEKRKIGMGRELLMSAIKYAKEQGNLCISARIVNNTEESIAFEIADKLLLNHGFKIIQTSTVVRCAVDKNSSKAWDDFIEKKGDSLIKKNEKKGFIVVSFAAAGELINELKKRIGREFAAELNPDFYIGNKVDKLVSELSFIAAKDGIPVAFCIVTTVDGKKVIVQQLSVAQKYKKSGVFLLPLVASINKIFLENRYSKVSYTVYDTNREMKRLVEGFLEPLIERRKIQNFYSYDSKRKNICIDI